jgi:hypothetical protein
MVMMMAVMMLRPEAHLEILSVRPRGANLCNMIT